MIYWQEVWAIQALIKIIIMNSESLWIKWNWRQQQKSYKRAAVLNSKIMTIISEKDDSIIQWRSKANAPISFKRAEHLNRKKYIVSKQTIYIYIWRTRTFYPTNGSCGQIIHDVDVPTIEKRTLVFVLFFSTIENMYIE